MNIPKIRETNPSNFQILQKFTEKNFNSSKKRKNLSEEEKWLANKVLSLLLTSPSVDIPKMAHAISFLLPSVHYKELQEFVASQNMQKILLSKEMKSSILKDSKIIIQRNNLNRRTQLQNTRELPTYVPCTCHKGVCDELNELCSCDHSHYCDKYCECSDDCFKRFKVFFLKY